MSEDNSGSGYVEREYKRDARYIPARITADGPDGCPVEPGRYRLVVARACPWANRAIHRAAPARPRAGISMGVCGPPTTSAAGPSTSTRAAVTRSSATNGCRRRSSPASPTTTAASPCPRWSTSRRCQVVTNDFPQITLDLSTEWTAHHGDGAPDLYPEHLRDEMHDVMHASSPT